MNWFVEKPATKSYHADFEPCEHVEADASVAYMTLAEMDSYGIVDGSIMCRECYKSLKAKEAAVLVTCNDCRQEVPQRDTIAWKSYHFHAPQGDEPVIVCSACQAADRHKRRVRDDQYARQQEEDMNTMDPYDDELYDDDDE